MEEIKLNITTENNEIVVRHGAALALLHPRVIDISGTIGVVAEYLSVYYGQLSVNPYILVNRDEKSITYFEYPRKERGTRVVGVLSMSKEYETFGINTGMEWGTFKLADMIRMNRSLFEDKTVASELVSVLRNFEAKVQKDVEQSDDKRANVTLLRRQSVATNIPPGFKMKMPLFKGMPPEVLEIEIDIDPDDFACQLVSPMASEIIQSTTDKIIDDQISAIKEITKSEVPILEI